MAVRKTSKNESGSPRAESQAEDCRRSVPEVAGGRVRKHKVKFRATEECHSSCCAENAAEKAEFDVVDINDNEDTQ